MRKDAGEGFRRVGVAGQHGSVEARNGRDGRGQGEGVCVLDLPLLGHGGQREVSDGRVYVRHREAGPFATIR